MPAKGGHGIGAIVVGIFALDNLSVYIVDRDVNVADIVLKGRDQIDTSYLGHGGKDLWAVPCIKDKGSQSDNYINIKQYIAGSALLTYLGP